MVLPIKNKGNTMTISFSEMGTLKAKDDIESSENGGPMPSSPLKPFTIKAPEHLIEVLDVVASIVGLSRSALVVSLLENCLAQSLYSFLSSYTFEFVLDGPEENRVLNHLEKLLNESKCSPEARSFLLRSVADYAFNS